MSGELLAGWYMGTGVPWKGYKMLQACVLIVDAEDGVCVKDIVLSTWGFSFIHGIIPPLCTSSAGNLIFYTDAIF